MRVDGFALSALGVVVEDAQGRRDGADERVPTATVPGYGEVELTDEPTPSPRRITVIATQSAPTVGELQVQLRALKARLRPGRLVAVGFSDDPDLVYFGRCESISAPSIAPAFVQRAHRLRIVIICPDPQGYDASETTVAVGGAPTPLPLGTGMHRPVVMITGPATDPVLEYRAGGVVVGRMGLGVSLGSGESLVVDSGRVTIRREDGTSAAEALASGDFLRFEGRHGAATLARVSGSAAGVAVTYRRAYL